MQIKTSFRSRVFPAMLAGIIPATAIAIESSTADPEPTVNEVISEVVVTSQRRQQPRLLHAGNIQRLDTETIERVQHQHIHELMNRVAGAWMVRGSGQEHQTAIRSPVLTGGGSCGGFLILEDGIPIRPAGFCNVNQLMEADTEQAQAIEVIRGPGNALFGSNALHGIVNVLMPVPAGTWQPQIAIELGANDFIRGRVALPFDADGPWVATAVYARDGGFRADSGYRQGKMHLKRRVLLADGDFTVAFTATDLRQDTAGFVYGKDAYKDPGVNRSNPDPEAFRDASSQRLYGLWSRSLTGVDLDIRPYIRHSDMRFLHHAIPGQPLEENGQVSTGFVSAATFKRGALEVVTGVDFEWARAFVKQTQSGPATGSPRQRATRPQGKHYDYDVRALTVAPFVQTSYPVGAKLSLGAGLRLEYTHYDYNNRMLAGNTREDGSSCPFGGCLYTRPADRKDSFTNLVPNLSAGFELNDQTRLYASLSRGFRAPQMIELYRLQNGQRVSDLDSERIDSFEAGLRTSRENWSADLSIYAMRKRDSVFRDAEGFNVSGARSRHRGIETTIDWRMAPAWYFAVDASYARHTYDFDFSPGRGESFVSGNEIDTAPRWLATAELRYEPAGKWWAGLQWTYLGEYFLEPANRHIYPGHQLLNLRLGAALTSKIKLVLRFNNITDKLIADRADFGGGDYRYLPGRGRELFAEIRYAP